MNIKLKEAFCGLTLRTGTLVLLWAILILDGFLFWVYSSDLLYHTLPANFLESFLESRVPSHHLIGYTLGIFSSLLGIISIQQNMPKYLIFSFFYFCYYVLYYILGVTILIISPTSYRSIIWGSSVGFYDATDVIPVFSNVFLYLSLIGLMSYFAIVVRCCRNAMMENCCRIKNIENALI